MLDRTEIAGQLNTAEQADVVAPARRARKGAATNSEGRPASAEQAIAKSPSEPGETPAPIQIEGRRDAAEQASGNAPSPRGRKRRADQSTGGGRSRRAEQAEDLAPPPVDTFLIIAECRQLQKERRLAIKQRSRCDRAVEAFLASQAGYRPKVGPNGERLLDADGKPVMDKEGKKLWAEVGRVRKAVEAYFKGNQSKPPPAVPAWASIPMIRANMLARQPWDDHKEMVEKRMEELAEQLPVWPWWKEHAKGGGPKWLGVIVGEAGDVGSYRNESALWKRCGLAVIDGERQRKKGGEDALRHAYSAQRRSVLWNVAEGIVKAQWRGDRDEDGKACRTTGKPVVTPGHACGRYGEHYARRKAYVTERERVVNDREPWSPKHINDDAKRYMTKKLLRDLRAAWREMAA